MRGISVLGIVSAVSIVVTGGACQAVDEKTSSGEAGGGGTAPDVEILLHDIEVVSADDAGVPTFANGKLGRIDVRRAEPTLNDEAEALRPAISNLRKVLHIDPEEVVLERAVTDNIGDRHYVFQQRKNGLEVIGASLVLHTRSGEIYAVHGKARTDLDAPLDVAIDVDTAIQIVEEDLSLLSELTIEPAPQMAYRLLNGKLELVYRVKAKGVQRDGLPVHDDVLINASDGSIVGRIPHIHAAKSREVHNAGNSWVLPGPIARSEGGAPAADSTVNVNYTHLGTTYDCYQKLFGRDSFNNAGATMISSVHLGSSYVNAFWNGSQMAFGDGDGWLSGNLAISPDVVAHELTHAVTEASSDLIYQYESGGLNESMSDIFASICAWYRDGSVVNADTWKIGEDVWTPGTAGDALRYLNDPKLDGSSLDFYADYSPGVDVHHSSGISNLAFYLLAQGGSHPRGRSGVWVSGIGMLKAAQVFYRANTVTLLGNSDATFAEAKIATEQATAQLGYSSATIASVSAAWTAVGVGVSVPACAHSRCVTGTALNAGCNWCTDSICDVDPYCCTTAWDSICVGEVQSVCHSLQCSSPTPSCPHSLCTTGTVLSPTCDVCVSNICAVDPYCCTTAWDSLCVGEVNSVCGMNCG